MLIAEWVLDQFIKKKIKATFCLELWVKQCMLFLDRQVCHRSIDSTLCWRKPANRCFCRILLFSMHLSFIIVLQGVVQLRPWEIWAVASYCV